MSATYTAASVDYPYLKEAIATVADQAIALWYTDRATDSAVRSSDLFAGCASGARPTIVVYGLPQKDCADKFSSDGTNTNSTGYRQFLQQLADKVANRAVVYILEPDAIGLLTDAQGCGHAAGYAANLRVALDVLGRNPNADIYLDVGYWTLGDDAQAAKVAAAVRQVDTAGRCKGIALNSANYRPVTEMAESCQRFAKAAAATKAYRCIVDTSRSYAAPPQFEWCNSKTGGMGVPPARNPVSGLIDYYVWVKPPGESDGACTGRTADAMLGPDAGKFFPEFFVSLWNNGYFVRQLGKPRLDAAKVRAPAPTPTPTPTITPAPTTPKTPSTCSIQDNVDYKGNDIGNAHAATAEACCAICSARAGCGAFSWTDYQGGTCWLKSGKGATSVSQGVRSAVVGGAAPACSPLTSGVDYTGNDLSSARSAAASGCCALCKGKTEAFTWTNYNGGTCWLKTATTKTAAQTGAVSGTIV